jgi:anti-sigma regulatory factor (Ser/Thr protein kinase)
MDALANRMSMSFKSNVKFCELSVLALGAIKGILSIDDDDFFKIEISLREAVNNAIVHGNGQDPQKDVAIIFDWDRHCLRIRVRDQHRRPTDFRQIEERITHNEVLSFNGRGITIMRSYMDHFELCHGECGNEVLMEKRLR